MPSTITRRRLLGSVAVGGVATYSGYRFLPAKFVPAPILEQRTKWRSVPKVDTALPVAPEAIDDSREHLQTVVSRAEKAWNDVEDSDVDGEREEFDRGLESSLEVSRERLSETERANPTTATLQKLRHGVNRAAGSLAAAKAIVEDYDPKALRERSKALQRDVNDFANAVSYEVAEPRRGLAYLFRSERAILLARMKADNVPSEDATDGEFDHRAVVEAIRSEIEGKRWLGDARAIYDFHRSNVADSGTPTDLEAHLDRTWRGFGEQIDKLVPDREEAVERYFTEAARQRDEEGPREWATQELFNNGYSAADEAYPPSGLRKGLLALVAVEHAKALQHALGFTSAMERLDEAFSDGGEGGSGGGGVSMALAARTKHEAITKLRNLLGDADDPITRELAARPREETVIGDWSLGVSPTFESEYPYAEAYAMYLLAAENLSHTAEVRDALLP